MSKRRMGAASAIHRANRVPFRRDMSHELCHLWLWQNAENSGWNSPGAGVACRYGQIHRGVDTGPGHHGIDRIFQTITIGLMFPSAARPIAVNGGGMGRAMRSPPSPLPPLVKGPPSLT